MKHDGPIAGALQTKDESRILSWSEDNTLRLWDAVTGQPIGPAMKHDGPVAGALPTKDESRILSWSEDKTLRLWDTASGQPIGPAMKHDGPVAGALLTKDESRILSWAEDKTLRLWDAVSPNGNLLEIACAFLDDYDAIEASKHYGVTIRNRICSPATATKALDWSRIVRAP
jgi:WD40 repeat protein